MATKSSPSHTGARRGRAFKVAVAGSALAATAAIGGLAVAASADTNDAPKASTGVQQPTVDDTATGTGATDDGTQPQDEDSSAPKVDDSDDQGDDQGDDRSQEPSTGESGDETSGDAPAGTHKSNKGGSATGLAHSQRWHATVAREGHPPAFAHNDATKAEKHAHGRPDDAGTPDQHSTDPGQREHSDAQHPGADASGHADEEGGKSGEGSKDVTGSR